MEGGRWRSGLAGGAIDAPYTFRQTNRAVTLLVEVPAISQAPVKLTFRPQAFILTFTAQDGEEDGGRSGASCISSLDQKGAEKKYRLLLRTEGPLAETESRFEMADKDMVLVLSKARAPCFWEAPLMPIGDMEIEEVFPFLGNRRPTQSNSAEGRITPILAAEAADTAVSSHLEISQSGEIPLGSELGDVAIEGGPGAAAAPGASATSAPVAFSASLVFELD